MAQSREWRLPWERGQPPFRPFTNILQVEGDAGRALPDLFAMEGFKSDLVQIGGVAEMYLIDMDTLSIEQNKIPGGGCSDVLERESGEVELPLANAMYQLDA